jgi:hypothetical protein
VSELLLLDDEPGGRVVLLDEPLDDEPLLPLVEEPLVPPMLPPLDDPPVPPMLLDDDPPELLPPIEDDERSDELPEPPLVESSDELPLRDELSEELPLRSASAVRDEPVAPGSDAACWWCCSSFGSVCAM